MTGKPVIPAHSCATVDITIIIIIYRYNNALWWSGFMFCSRCSRGGRGDHVLVAWSQLACHSPSWGSRAQRRVAPSYSLALSAGRAIDCCMRSVAGSASVAVLALWVLAFAIVEAVADLM